MCNFFFVFLFLFVVLRERKRFGVGSLLQCIHWTYNGNNWKWKFQQQTVFGDMSVSAHCDCNKFVSFWYCLVWAACSVVVHFVKCTWLNLFRLIGNHFSTCSRHLFIPLFPYAYTHTICFSSFRFAFFLFFNSFCGAYGFPSSIKYTRHLNHCEKENIFVMPTNSSSCCQ